MKTLQFKCKLLTDVVLRPRSATENNQECIDFISGNNFLGIAAGSLYYKPEDKNKLSNEDSWKVFHSGKVRFGDAHPMQTDKRALRVPAGMFQPKLSNDKTVYIHHEIEDFEKVANLQLKQCRKGFYIFDKNEGREVGVEKSFAIKSAYDRETRRSKDKKMCGYESLQAGSEWLFEVSIDDDLNVEQEITDALQGTKRIGRSRTAQYGLVKIDVAKPFQTELSTPITDHAVVYADARLIFLDEYGLPALQPVVTDLGFSGGEINWSKSQIRTFQYAPWNFKRQARDADRCGIEKGSVIYVQKSEDADKLEYTGNGWVGVYQNEGFGKILINPVFLEAYGNNGEALFQLGKTEKEDKGDKVASTDPLFLHLKSQAEQVKKENEIYSKVNKFIGEYKDKCGFTKEAFASQWGTVRSIAVQNSCSKKLRAALFDDKTGYLTHGVAKEKWEERDRIGKFRNFFDDLSEEFTKDELDKKRTDRAVQSAIINLSAEMAKIARRK